MLLSLGSGWPVTPAAIYPRASAHHPSQHGVSTLHFADSPACSNANVMGVREQSPLRPYPQHAGTCLPLTVRFFTPEVPLLLSIRCVPWGF